ncbi:hemin uptake protein HemP [Methylocystis echinoides]|uniref:hemin uptake protein HemP n=1 Tax=Methylocystis echinoides TaxID=29468 RepID=UPI00343909B6
MEKERRTRRHRQSLAQAPNSDCPALEIDTRDLLGRRQEATIVHAGERYRLRITANNKLILTK